MKDYINLLQDVFVNGVLSPNRTGTNAYSVFGRQIRFDLSQGFPLLTTKKVHFHSVVHELLWFLSGSTNIKYLNDNGVRIWDEWADIEGELGPVYGKQWRSWVAQDGTVYDQIRELVTGLQTNPESRRHIVSAWNVGELDKMALAPCHCLFQFHVSNNTLSCQLYQRSADIFLGVPFNIASYALLTHMVAQQCGLAVGEFIHTFGDLHLYENHMSQATLQLSRTPKVKPVLHLKQAPSIFEYTADDINLIGYNPDPPIKGKVAV